MNILLAIDESPYAGAIADFVLQHPWSNDARFCVLHVVEPLLIGSYMSLLPSVLLEKVHDQAQARGRQLVHTVAERLQQALPNVPVTEQVLEGFPKEAIVNFAVSWPADFIVVGSHGRHGLESLFFGSVSRAVCYAAPCSVLVVRLKQQHGKTGTAESSHATQLSA